MHSPVTPWVLAGRIFAILGMAFTAAAAILFLIAPFWWWALGAALAFVPFFLLIVVVERFQSKHGLIGPPDHSSSATDADLG
jgi:membrane protein implicated in regulation of membrane protease activity